MSHARRVVLKVGLAVAALAVVACQNSKSNTPTNPSGPTVTFVLVTGNAPATGTTSQFTATAVYSDQSSASVTAQATWKSSDPAILSVTAGGLVTGVTAGTADISATFQNITGTTPVTASATPCLFTVQPSSLSLPKEGGSASVTVTVTQGAGCAWSAQVNQPFLTITSGASGTGNGTVTVSALPNTGILRSGSLTVAGRTVDVTQMQSDCVTSISPATQAFTAAGGTGAITVAAPAGCAWAAVNGGPFITLVKPYNGTGNGAFSYIANGNLSGTVMQAPIGVERFQTMITEDKLSGTYLAFEGDSGEYISQGKTWVYLGPATGFGTSMASANQVTISVLNTNGSALWSLNLQAPSGVPLVPGGYEGATRYPFQVSSAPGLDLHGDGRGCNMVTGRFTVLDAAYGPGPTLTRFWATFEHHCEGGAKSLRGEVSFGR